MKVTLKQHIMEGGGIKCAVKAGATVPFVKGAVIEVSDATAAKWIEKGLAEAHVEQDPEAE